MKTVVLKMLKIAAVFGGGFLMVRLAGPRLGERMDQMFKNASNDFPPKWMYLNITAIRDNTERILEALASEQADADTAAA